MDSSDHLFENTLPPTNFNSQPKTSRLSFVVSAQANCLMVDDNDEDEVNIDYSKNSISYLTEKFTLNSYEKFSICPNEYSVLKCPICVKDRRQFFCANCIRNGDFSHSKRSCLERFADKKLKFIKFKDHQMQVSNAVQKHFYNIILKDDLTNKVNEVRKNIKTLGKLINEKNSYIAELKSVLIVVQRNKLTSQQKQFELKKRTRQLKNLLERQNVEMNQCVNQKSNTELNIQLMIREKLNSLTTFIYSIDECSDNVEESIQENSFNSEDTPLLSLVSETSSTSNFSQSPTTVAKFKIVDSWINADGEYNLNFSPSHSTDDIRDNNFRNDEHRIRSALSYLCHLTNLIAHICDINLPKMISFSDFYFRETKKDEFVCKVAKLNANVLFMCLYHQVDFRLLHPKHSFKNIRTLLNTSKFNAILDNYVEINNVFFKIIQDSLLNDIYSSNNGGGCFSEAVDLNVENDYYIIESNIPDLSFDTDNQQNTNFLTNFVSSLYKRSK